MRRKAHIRKGVVSFLILLCKVVKQKKLTLRAAHGAEEEPSVVSVMGLRSRQLIHHRLAIEKTKKTRNGVSIVVSKTSGHNSNLDMDNMDCGDYDYHML